MKFILTVAILGSLSSVPALAQSGQSPVMQQSTATSDNRQANPVRPMLKRKTAQQQQRMHVGLDTTRPKKPAPTPPKQRRLPPDSLRRGGAVRVDTI